MSKSHMTIPDINCYPDNDFPHIAGLEDLCESEVVVGSSYIEDQNQNETDVPEVMLIQNDNSGDKVMPNNGCTVKDGAATGLTPKKGMKFESLEGVYEYYYNYAKAIGFGIIKGSSTKCAGSVTRRFQYWHCDRGPENKQDKGRSGEGAAGKKRASKKCGCGAKLSARLNKDGLWEIYEFEVAHMNHVPTPSKSRFVPSFRQVPKFILRMVKDLMDAGVTQAQIYRALTNQLGGFDNISFLLKDLNNEVGRDRAFRFAETDCREMFDYFSKMKEQNDDFYFAWRVDEDNQLKDVVWVDARSRVAYKDFCDVVCFDATYITNRYELPFANFVGVNQHGQSILLGCAIVRYEDTETYEWIMRKWLECMNGVQSGGIITDQSAPIGSAIKEVFPDSRHRLCVWHILSKVPRKLLSVQDIGTFLKKMKNVVYDSLFPEEFEQRWMDLINKHGLGGDEWLRSLWELRDRWVPTFVKDVFWAGVSTTQRVESINHFFKGFLTSKTTLREFVKKYTRAIHHRANAEAIATANDERRRFRIRSKFPLYESFFRNRYTAAKFDEVLGQIMELQCCRTKSVDQISGHEKQFYMLDRWQVGDPPMTISKELKLYLNTDSLDMRCDCRMFEHRGIMCMHMFRVMVDTEMPDVPERFVLERWRKDFRRKHLDVVVSFNDPSKTPDEIRYGKLQFEFEALFQMASESDELCEYAIESAWRLLKDLSQVRSASTGNDTSTGVATDTPSAQGSNNSTRGEGGYYSNVPDNPAPVRRIGRPPGKTKHGIPPKKRKTTASVLNGSSQGSVNHALQMNQVSNHVLSQQASPYQVKWET